MRYPITKIIIGKYLIIARITKIIATSQSVKGIVSINIARIGAAMAELLADNIAIYIVIC